jgi:hypothetical protein
MQTQIINKIIDFNRRIEHIQNNNFTNIILNIDMDYIFNIDIKNNIKNIKYKINELEECPVCYEKCVLNNNFECIHGLCNNCYNSLKSYLKICPLCRSK